LNESSSVPSPTASQINIDRLARKSIDEDIDPSSQELGMKNKSKKKIRIPNFLF
jgi:hypothetical protein